MIKGRDADLYFMLLYAGGFEDFLPEIEKGLKDSALELLNRQEYKKKDNTVRIGLIRRRAKEIFSKDN